jgi:hypothetical protein
VLGEPIAIGQGALRIAGVAPDSDPAELARQRAEYRVRMEASAQQAARSALRPKRWYPSCGPNASGATSEANATSSISRKSVQPPVTRRSSRARSAIRPGPYDPASLDS